MIKKINKYDVNKLINLKQNMLWYTEEIDECTDKNNNIQEIYKYVNTFL